MVVVERDAAALNCTTPAIPIRKFDKPRVLILYAALRAADRQRRKVYANTRAPNIGRFSCMYRQHRLEMCTFIGIHYFKLKCSDAFLFRNVRIIIFFQVQLVLCIISTLAETVHFAADQLYTIRFACTSAFSRLSARACESHSAVILRAVSVVVYAKQTRH